MDWRGRRQSRNIDDRRSGRRSGGHRSGGRRRGAARAAGGGGIGIIILALIAMFFGVDPSMLLNSGSDLGQQQQFDNRSQATGPNDEMGAFMATVLASTEDVWGEIFARQGQRYEQPVMTLFQDRVTSACGFQSAATGPFYCPGDRRVYLDTSFFDQLSRRFGAPGDFAQAYVVAHEVGHHIQTILGISRRVAQEKRGKPKAIQNELSVRQELQADCFAGVWAFHANKKQRLLERGDIEEALRAAAAIGDDRLQRQSRGFVSPESFTHGSSRQRQEWFLRGMDRGEVADCDSFGTQI